MTEGLPKYSELTPTDGVAVICGNHARTSLNEYYPNDMLERNLIDWYEWYCIAGHITKEEHSNVKAMLDSDDDENYVLAIEIIKIIQTKWNLNSPQKTTSTKQ